jgi:hypothetical protein
MRNIDPTGMAAEDIWIGFEGVDGTTTWEWSDDNSIVDVSSAASKTGRNVKEVSTGGKTFVQKNSNGSAKAGDGVTLLEGGAYRITHNDGESRSSTTYDKDGSVIPEPDAITSKSVGSQGSSESSSGIKGLAPVTGSLVGGGLSSGQGSSSDARLESSGGLNSLAWSAGAGSVAQSGGGGWVGPANSTNGGIGVLAGAVENLSGNASLGTNGKIYSSGWNGNQYVSTAKAAKVGKILGGATFVIGTGLDAIGVYNYYTKGANNPNAVSPAKAGTNLGIGAWGMINPATAVGAALYYGVDTFYPGGFNGAMQQNSSLIQQNQAILGSGFNLYRDH